MAASTSKGTTFWAKMASDKFTPPSDPTLPESKFEGGLVKRLQAEVATLRSSLLNKDVVLSSLKSIEEEDVQMEALARDHEALLDDMLAVMDVNERLRCENRQMKTFLRDYGLIWVGEPNKPTEPLPHGEKLERPTCDEVGVPVEILLVKLGELNDLVDSNAVVAKDPQKGPVRLQKRKGLLVEIFRDGIRLGGPQGSDTGDAMPAATLEVLGKIRGWKDAGVETFVRDVLDGFFPQEWRDAYPDGVLLDVRNCSRERAPRYRAFQGEGQRLGTVAGRDPIAERSRSPDKKQSSWKDPTPVIENRSGGAQPRVVKTRRCKETEARGNGLGSRICRVQVRRREPRSVVIVYILESETVMDLCEAIKTVDRSTDGVSGDMEVRTTYPNRVLAHELDIYTAGLCPSGTVVVKALETKNSDNV